MRGNGDFYGKDLQENFVFNRSGNFRRIRPSQCSEAKTGYGTTTVLKMATIEAYYRNQDYVHDFYTNMKPELLGMRSSTPDIWQFTRLQQEYPGEVHIITQNIDTLHEKAKSKNVIHIHGQINQAVCMNCGHVLETWGDVTSKRFARTAILWE